MQTAVEWLIEKMLDSGIGICKEWREQAKEMEKQQKIDFANNYSESDIYYCNGEFEIIKDAEQYYNETYGSKGSDDIGIMTPKNHVDVLCKAISSQTPKQ